VPLSRRAARAARSFPARRSPSGSGCRRLLRALLAQPASLAGRLQPLRVAGRRIPPRPGLHPLSPSRPRPRRPERLLQRRCPGGRRPPGTRRVADDPRSRPCRPWSSSPSSPSGGMATDQAFLAVVLGALDVGLAFWLLGRVPIRPASRRPDGLPGGRQRPLVRVVAGNHVVPGPRGRARPHPRRGGDRPRRRRSVGRLSTARRLDRCSNWRQILAGFLLASRDEPVGRGLRGGLPRPRRRGRVVDAPGRRRGAGHRHPGGRPARLQPCRQRDALSTRSTRRSIATRSGRTPT